MSDVGEHIVTDIEAISAVARKAGVITGVAVVDTFTAAAPAKDLLAEIRKITNLPVRYVINTHYHLDHVGGNAVFADAGAAIAQPSQLGAGRHVRGAGGIEDDEVAAQPHHAREVLQRHVAVVHLDARRQLIERLREEARFPLRGDEGREAVGELFESPDELRAWVQRGVAFARSLPPKQPAGRKPRK